jgi:hypothetical protein
MNITTEQWQEKLVELEKAIALRWPWMTVSVAHNEMRVESGSRNVMVAGQLALRIASDMRSLAPEARFSSGTAMCGSLSETAIGIRDYQAVLDVLHYCEANTERLRVFDLSQLPCSKCGGEKTVSVSLGRGKHERRPCGSCGGSGLQHPEQSGDVKP